MSERRDTVFPVPEGISNKQWPYEEGGYDDLVNKIRVEIKVIIVGKNERKETKIEEELKHTWASRAFFKSHIYEYCSG